MPIPGQLSETVPEPSMVHAMREAAGVWECACGVWGNYFATLATTATPEGILEANTRLFTDSLEVYGRAAGAMLRDSGLKAPTLNDA